MTRKKTKFNFLNIAPVLALAIFFLTDRLLKYKALSLLQAKELFSDFFLFSLTKNYFISFSLPFSGPFLNILISLLVTLLLSCIVFLTIRKKAGKFEIICLIAIFLGALSNLIDRLTLGFVIDYLELRGVSAFNLADVMISLASFSFIVHSFKRSS